MLSDILGMAYRFEREHGVTPNLLYLNQEHLIHLCRELGFSSLQLSERLGLAVMVSPDIGHPRVIHLDLPPAALGH